MSTEKVERAKDLIAGVMDDPMWCHQVGPTLACSEVDALAAALLLLDLPQPAALLIDGHADVSEEPEDSHWDVANTLDQAERSVLIQDYLRTLTEQVSA
jgi:hypothetical protein